MALNRRKANFILNEKTFIVSDFDSKERMNLIEFRDFLDDLIEDGYGDFILTADTQDGSSYNVRNEVLALEDSHEIQIF